MVERLPDGLDEVVEALALDVFHADEEGPVDLTEVVDAADVRVRDLLGQRQLAAEALARLLLGDRSARAPA